MAASSERIIGWRAWSLVFLFLGIAISAVAFPVIITPAAAIVVLMVRIFQRRRR
jgi:hypothetical protein